MAIVGNLYSKAKAAVTKQAADLLNPAKLEKAKLYRVRGQMEMGQPITVQFNPAEYQVSRSTTMSKKNAYGQDPEISKLQAASGNFANLSLTLYFDTISDLTSVSIGDLKADPVAAAKSALMSGGGKDPREVCLEIATLLKYDPKERAPLRVRFAWGPFDFMGYVTSSSISYTMFAADGTPVRAKLSLTLLGEETAIMQQATQQSASSSGSTKARTLVEGDELWMLAQKEYADPAAWKPIAEANDILNPRKMNSATMLVLPSIK